MALAFHTQIASKLFQKCGTKERKQIIDITKIAASVGADVCHGLIGMHVSTGCNTVSTFAGKGKLGALKLLSSSNGVQKMFAKLGQEWIVAEDLMDKLENFTCLLYASKSGTKELNSLRYHLFCAKKGGIESHQLPPCNDCFRKHVQRANYQAAIWKRSLQRHPMTPNPVGKGMEMG